MIHFAAITLPAETVVAVQAVQEGVSIARWLPADALHITIRYFGDVDGVQTKAIRLGLRSIKVHPFPLEIAGVGLFLRPRNSVLWAAVKKHPELVALAACCDEAARSAGVEHRRGSNFFPHVALAYLQGRPAIENETWAERHRDFAPPAFPVTAIDLQSSPRDPDQPRHSLVERFPLGAG